MAKAELWANPEGLIFPKVEVTYHHVLPQSLAVSGLQKRFIRQHGLVVPMIDEWHKGTDKALHSNVPLAPMPGVFLMHRINQFTSEYEERRVYDRFIGIAGYVNDLAFTTSNTELAKEAGKIADNWQQQIPFIMEGMVHPVQGDRRE